MQAKLVAPRNDERRAFPSIDGHATAVNPLVALRELYELLEDYGPMWYTERAHNLARAALGENPLQ